MTFVVKLPVRNPVLVAKQVTSTAVLTGNRLVLGVGTSPWREDYEVLGVPWEDAGGGWTRKSRSSAGCRPGRTSSTTGRSSTFAPVKIAPVPGEPVPILIGGHRDAALRRAARVGDGWLHGGGDPAELTGLLARLAEFRHREGTADRPFQVHVISMEAYRPEGVRRLEDQGVTDVIVGFRWPYHTGPDREPLAVKLGKLRGFADKVIAKVR